MFIRTLFDGSKHVVELARFCGVAPCQILAANKCTESQLVGRIIDLPVSTPAMIRQLAWFYMVGQDGALAKTVAK